MARYDVRERHEIVIRAPAAVVLEAAKHFDLYSIPLVRSIIRMREQVMRARREPEPPHRGLVDLMRGFGWGTLVDQPGLYVAGARCQPWVPNVVFEPIPPDRFADDREPDRVKILWSLEAQEIASMQSRFATETRAVATDDRARAHFQPYWSWARYGIVAIRWLMLPALRREAEREWQARMGVA